MSVATEQTTKRLVDLWERETILRRKRIVIEAPSEWDAPHLARLDGEQLARLTEEYGCGDWQVEGVEDSAWLTEIDISGPVPEEVSADIVFVQDELQIARDRRKFQVTAITADGSIRLGITVHHISLTVELENAALVENASKHNSAPLDARLGTRHRQSQSVSHFVLG